MKRNKYSEWAKDNIWKESWPVDNVAGFQLDLEDSLFEGN